VIPIQAESNLDNAGREYYDIRLFFAQVAMSTFSKTYEFRCPVHGFIELNDWEREVVSQPVFQRLRRIRQLGWTEYVYPGATHTRFEHSLGVMFVASKLYDSVCERRKQVLFSELAFNDAGLQRDRQLVRLAALLHDVGHGPFSHASEVLMPIQQNGKSYEHQHYSAALIRTQLRDVIENHPACRNYGFKADDVAALIEGSATAKQSIFWRELITGQIDADRMDYLLRDSLHSGVSYGRFDLPRLIATVDVAVQADAESPRLAIAEGGWHAAEALVVARYLMFTQVYFHKTRVACDLHLREALRDLLPHGRFPAPIDRSLQDFLEWDDWKVLSLFLSGEGGEHGRRLRERNLFRRVYQTPETPDLAEWDKLRKVKRRVRSLIAGEEHASKSWYKTGPSDIPVVGEVEPGAVRPLSAFSSVVRNLAANNQVILYAKPEQTDLARTRVKAVLSSFRMGNRRRRPRQSSKTRRSRHRGAGERS
jgi:HD superfamily phosphohydrolase